MSVVRMKLASTWQRSANKDASFNRTSDILTHTSTFIHRLTVNAITRYKQMRSKEGGVRKTNEKKFRPECPLNKPSKYR